MAWLESERDENYKCECQWNSVMKTFNAEQIPNVRFVRCDLCKYGI